ncbi:hypothetical protein ACFE04_001219 [Oxalis oulophora]
MASLSTEKGDLFGSSQLMKNKTAICGNPKNGTESSKDPMEIEVPTPSKDTNTSLPLKSQPWKSLFIKNKAHTPDCDIPFIPPVVSNVECPTNITRKIWKAKNGETKVVSVGNHETMENEMDTPKEQSIAHIGDAFTTSIVHDEIMSPS